MSVFDRVKAMGTAKLRVLAFDAKTRRPLVDSDAQLARADYRHWDLLGAGPIVSGKVSQDLTAATGESQSIVDVPASIAKIPKSLRRQ
jgi:hypothetical protein